MSTFDKDAFRWRETYFVLFESSGRPTLVAVEQALKRLSDRFQLTDLVADAKGRFESLTLLAPDDYAALDISYLAGEDVLAQGQSLATELKAASCETGERTKLQRLPHCDARLDIMHFEQVVSGDDMEGEDMLDPSALLIVLDALVKLTGGIGVDPQSGVFM